MTNLRLQQLRTALVALGVDAMVIPRGDEYLGEYVPPRAERLAWLTGFTGSAGLAVVLPETAALFTDGRYMLQAVAEVDPAAFTIVHVTEDPPPAWVAARATRIGYDPWLFSEEAIARYLDAGLTMIPLSPNPIDALWPDRPAAPCAPAVPHALAIAGRSASDKRTTASAEIAAAGQSAVTITDPASLNWLLNIRGGDLPFTPVALCYGVLHADARLDLYIDPAKLDPAMGDWLGPSVACHRVEAFAAGLAALAGALVRVDGVTAPAAVAQILRQAGATVIMGSDPCTLPKACKTDAEQDAIRRAHHHDARAICRFLHWLDACSSETELSAAARLLAFRTEAAGFQGESFPAISGSGPNGAIIHYRVSPTTNRAIGPNEPYLIDSGGQYADGTTDVTRTVWIGPGDPPAVLQDRYTRVLQGHIALARTVFPHGVAGPHLDAIARRPLWALGLDYDHGTGHGVGQFLSVHEGPAGLSRAARLVAIEAGMVLSNEPGFYASGEYGIRLENLQLVQRAQLGVTRPFLEFETLTLAPFDRRLIDVSLLEPGEIAWIDGYHARVALVIGPTLHGAAAGWLAQACRPIG